jgi:hypothetical protein
MDCNLCDNKRHVQNPQTLLWEDCECLLKARRDERCRLAGIPAEYWTQTVSQLKGLTVSDKVLLPQLKKVAHNLKQGFCPSNVILTGQAPRHKVLGWLTLKAGLYHCQGLSIGLDDLTTAFLTNDKSAFIRAKDVKVLHIVVGDEYTQTVHKYVLKHLVDHRSEARFCTIWSTQLPKRELVGRYGELSVFATDATIWLNIPGDSQI